MIEIKIGKHVPYPYPAFKDRRDAVQKLVEFIGEIDEMRSLISAIPRGGVSVGQVLCEAYKAPMELALTRKLPIPWSPEAGFGAVTIDGTVSLNEDFFDQLNMTKKETDKITERVIAELKRRAAKYAVPEKLLQVERRRVYVVDDGLATGYTAIAAAQMIRKRNPSELVLAVPASPADTLKRVSAYFDKTYCLIEQKHLPFAVASFYHDFHDMTDEEVNSIITELTSGKRK